MRVTVLTPLILLACFFPAIGESSENASSAAPSNGELKMVVALFRHGVRAPLHDIDAPNKYGKNSWPTMSEWGVTKWGDLTPHGAALASALGRDYAQTYRKNWRSGFTAFLWADTSERTMATAQALSAGLEDGGVTTTVASLARGPDPLFHPFEAHCGAQGLHEMRQSDGKSCPAFRVPVRCANSKPGSDTCTLPLNTLIDAVGEDFLSRCEHGQQVCP